MASKRKIAPVQTTHQSAAESYMVARSRQISKYFSLLSIIFPLFSAVGWVFRIPLLTQGHPALPAMQPNTILGLGLSAVVIFLAREDSRSPAFTWMTCSLAAIVSLLGLLTLCEYVFACNIGIDDLLIHGAASASQPFPGRPSPQTSFNFLVLGLPLLSLQWRWMSINAGQSCAILVGANALIAATGYIFSTSQFYGFPLYIPAIGMAVHTSAGFILLAAALLFSRPKEGMMSLVTSDTQSGSIARKILVSGIVLPPLVGVITKLGVLAGWYDVGVQISLFAVLIVGLILRTTWKAAKQAEQEELRAQSALASATQANHKLRHAVEERSIFAALVENSSDFIGIADPDGKPIYLNQGGRRMVGLSADFPVNTTQILDYYPPNQSEFASDVIIKAVTEKGHWRGQTYFRNWITEAAIPVSDEHFVIRDPQTNRILGMGTVTRDISELKQAQEQSRKSQERLDLALRGADLATWDWNIQTGEVTFNSRWSEMRGFRPEEIKPHVDTWFSNIHPDDITRVQKALTDYFEGIAKDYSVEFRALTESKGWIWILDRGSVFERDSQGRPTRMVGTELDITNRKRFEEELRASEAKFSGIVSISADAIISVDENQRITLFNEGAQEIFGYANEDGVGQSLEILIPEGFRAAHRQLVERFAKGTQISRHTGQRTAKVSGRRKNGEEFPADAAISKLEVGGKRVLTVTIRDITEQKRIEAELQILADKAQNATKAREDVLAIVSHDLKSPLASIGLTAQLLHKANKIDLFQVRDLSARIEHAVDQMQKLIGDLLNFGKMQGGTFTVEKYREDPVKVILPIVETVRIQAETKRQHFEVDLSRDLPAVACDAPYIGQVLSNLLGNAIKFTPEGGTIRLMAKSEKDRVLISISDTGPGIPPEQLPHVFDRFWQAKESKHLGSGLGLSIAKGIVDAHGAKIWAESQKGKGTCFLFTIPVASSETKTRALIPPISATRSDANSLSGTHIMLVDDSQDVLFLMRHILQKVGATVTNATSVPEALSKIAQNRPDLIITDIEMPDGDGYDLVATVRQMTTNNRQPIPVVAFTAHSTEQTLTKIDTAGFDARLSKPVQVEEMLSSIQHLLSQNHSH